MSKLPLCLLDLSTAFDMIDHTVLFYLLSLSFGIMHLTSLDPIFQIVYSVPNIHKSCYGVPWLSTWTLFTLRCHTSQITYFLIVSQSPFICWIAYNTKLFISFHPSSFTLHAPPTPLLTGWLQTFCLNNAKTELSCWVLSPS